MKTVLVIDDQARCLALCRQVMPSVRFIGPATSWREASRILRRRRRVIDAVLLDVVFDRPDDELVGLPADPTDLERRDAQRTQGLRILERLRAAAPGLPVVLMTSHRRHASLPSLGSYTILFDDDRVDAGSLKACIGRALALSDTPLHSGPVYWGKDPVMGRLRQRLLATARGRPTLLIEGETGTGKSLVSRHVVHEATGRSGPFVALDLATIPPDLMAARLFGVVRGAYTGADADRPGAFEHAQGGTLFLDEIGNLTPDAQRLLLSVLQERRVTRLGCLREREVDVKVIAATNEDLGSLVEDGTFRRDLYMRLNPAGALRIPPLRDRPDDLLGAVEHLMSILAGEPELRPLLDAYGSGQGTQRSVRVAVGSTPPQPSAGVSLWFPEESWRLLREHRWPGNLRELKSVLENLLWNTLGLWSEFPMGQGTDVITIHPWQISEMLGERAVPDDNGHGVSVVVQSQPTLNGVSVDLERQVYRHLYLASGGAFSSMAKELLGDASLGRKVQLRFNQLGLRVRDLKAMLA